MEIAEPLPVATTVLAVLEHCKNALLERLLLMRCRPFAVFCLDFRFPGHDNSKKESVEHRDLETPMIVPKQSLRRLF